MANSVLARQNHGQFQLTITLPAKDVEKTYKSVLTKEAEKVNIPGFRKGKAPLSKVEAQLDKNKLYEKVLQKLLPEYYANAIKEHGLKPVVEPRFELIQSEENKDWQIRATCAEMPTIKLGDYKKGLKGLLKSADIWTPEKGSAENVQKEDEDKKELSPEQLKQQNSQKVTEWLLKNIEVEIPEIMITEQANVLLSRLLDQVQKLGLSLEQYLASTNKKLEDLKAEYAQRAKQEIKLELIVSEIGKAEGISVDDKEVDKLINETNDEKLKENMQKAEYKRQLKNILYSQKILDRLLKLAS